jgi:hypothetical protein
MDGHPAKGENILPKQVRSICLGSREEEKRERDITHDPAQAMMSAGGGMMM